MVAAAQSCGLYPCESPERRVSAAPASELAQLARQVAHWTHAASALSDFNRFASAEGWTRLERYLGVAIRKMVDTAVLRLRKRAAVLEARLAATEDTSDLQPLRDELLAFRDAYLRTEVILGFYGDAINTRTSEHMGRYLRACDTLAGRAMAEALAPLGRTAPPVLTYVDRGLGASILKAGLPLWDGHSVSAVAAIKIVRHNLYRPTSLLHEAGHQVAQMLDWNGELAAALHARLGRFSPRLAALWSGWASEIAGDAFGFVHTGFASVITLHDVIDGPTATVFRMVPGDPHPVAYLRLLLGCAMCTHCYGEGPWADTARSWRTRYPLGRAGDVLEELLQRSTATLPAIVEVVLDQPYRAFGGRSLRALVDPERVSPAALETLADAGGNSLFSSDLWIQKECLRLLALCGLRVAIDPTRSQQHLLQQEAWMLRLGTLAGAA